MRVFDLHFTNRARLLDGFRRAQSCEAVESCALEIESLRMCFTAPRLEAEALNRRIYLDAGLRWCSGHDLYEPGAV
mgnify:CR=1 FL=1|jgi:hypothetical protein